MSKDQKIQDKKLLLAIAEAITSQHIHILDIRHHLKASESYVDLKLEYPNDDFVWNGSIPYHYRRAGRFLDDPALIAALANEVYEAVKPANSKLWTQKESQLWNDKYAGRGVTKEFFMPLLNLEWNCISHDFPSNPNWARRIQDIKEMGYSLATNTKMWCQREGKNTTHILLLPLETAPQTGYEYISKQLRERVLKVLGGYDAYEGEKRPSRYLLPDHKFPEIGWDAETRNEDIGDLTDEEIKEKFQLLDNHRNLQKREVSRRVFQTQKRGTIFGIKYYYQGDENWPEGVPLVGAESEKGWVGSPWYDIEAWRNSLNSKLEALRQYEKLTGRTIEEDLELKRRNTES